MQTICKYRLDVTEAQILTVTKGAELLTVQMQNGQPHIMARLDTDPPSKTRTIVMVGTGRLIADDDLTYVGTVQIGAYVWLYFEKVAQRQQQERQACTTN